MQTSFDALSTANWWQRQGALLQTDLIRWWGNFGGSLEWSTWNQGGTWRKTLEKWWFYDGIWWFPMIETMDSTMDSSIFKHRQLWFDRGDTRWEWDMSDETPSLNDPRMKGKDRTQKQWMTGWWLFIYVYLCICLYMFICQYRHHVQHRCLLSSGCSVKVPQLSQSFWVNDQCWFLQVGVAADSLSHHIPIVTSFLLRLPHIIRNHPFINHHFPYEHRFFSGVKHHFQTHP